MYCTQCGLTTHRENPYLEAQNNRHEEFTMQALNDEGQMEAGSCMAHFLSQPNYERPLDQFLCDNNPSSQLRCLGAPEIEGQGS